MNSKCSLEHAQQTSKDNYFDEKVVFLIQAGLNDDSQWLSGGY